MTTIRNWTLGLLIALAAIPAMAQNRTRFAGEYAALDYAYGVQTNFASPLRVDIGTTATGSGTLTLAYGNIALGDGTVVMPLSTNAPITVGVGTNAETVTPSAVSCNTPNIYDTCTVTATFSNTHGVGDLIQSGTYGLQEAVNAASTAGGGTVVTTSAWISAGGSKTIITAVVSTTPKVWIMDRSGVAPVFYGKSGTTSAAYSAVNNDMTFQLTLASGTATKTLSQTYAIKPNCVGTYISGTTTGILTVAPTTTTVVVTDSVSEANVVQVHCDLQK
jgi:hypothetical protein